MVLFLATEAMFFAGLISATLVLRAQVPLWPPADQPRLPVWITGINTLLLLGSGYVLFLSLKAYWHYRFPAFKRLFLTCITLGTVFVFVQGYEWVRLVVYGLADDAGIATGVFYVLVGTHGVHALAGLFYLSIAGCRALRRRYSMIGYTRLKLCFMYWLFVVGIWPLLYLLVYF